MLRCIGVSLLLLLGILAPGLNQGQAHADDRVLQLSTISDNGSLVIGEYLQVFLNRDSQVSPAQILSGQWDDQFIPSKNGLLTKGFFQGTVWMRLVVDNDLGSPQEFILDSRFAPLDEVTFYQKAASGLFLAESQGDSVLPDSATVRYRHPIFKFHAEPGRQLYYISVKSAGSNVIYLSLSKAETHRRYEFFDTMMLSLFFGTIITLLLYNGFLTLSFRSRSYVYYTLFLFSMALTQMGLQGLWPLVLPYELSHWAQNTGLVISLAGACAFAGLISQSFLNTRHHMLRFHRFLTVYITASILVVPLALVFGTNLALQMATVIFSVGSLGIILGSLISIMRGYRPAFAFCFSWLFFLVSNISMALLLEGLWHIPILVQWGNLPGIVCEGILMSFALASRVNYFRAKSEATIKGLNEELKKHLSQVEALVAERTNTIRTIVDNVASGFLMIDRHCRVLPGYTRSCETLFLKPIEAGADVLALMQTRGPVATQFRLAIEQIFADILPLEASLAQLPHDISAQGRAFHLAAAPIRNESGEVGMILLTITDATELRRKKAEAHHNRRLVKQLSDISGFRQFIASSVQAIGQLKALVHHRGKERKEIALILHTLKGNCSLFQLNAIARFIHGLEEKKPLQPADIESLENRFMDYLGTYQKLLQTSWTEEQGTFHISREDLDHLRRLLRTSEPKQLSASVDHWLRSIEAIPVAVAFRALAADGKRVAKRLGKIVDIEVIDNGVRLQSQVEQKLTEELIHLVRNAIVHGIEDDRKVLNKAERGRIRLEAQELPDGLVLKCQDDGRGFDAEHWKAAWAEKNPGQEPPRRLVDLVRGLTQHSYSTAEEVSLYAGRGVGMEALFQAVDRCEATIEIDSKPGEGAAFTVIVPRARQQVDAAVA